MLREIDRLSAIFSGYDPASEFRRWQAGGQGSPRRSRPSSSRSCGRRDDWQARSGGAFDPRVEALSRLWSRWRPPGPAARRRARWPRARALDDRPAWRLDPARGTAERLSDCPLSLNGIAKGYIVERACDAALDRGRGRHAA